MSDRRTREGGMSLAEVLVATAILAIAVVAALVLYDAARKSFKRGENATEQQQAVRIAFDKLNADLRMAGFNYNPDGAVGRPDEQIEAAYDTAIVLRADFDAEDPAASGTPEVALAGGAYLSVSTGNDEIVAYVLAKPDGSSTDTLTFQADVSESKRDGDVETVTIPNVALVQNDPPYTLYRVTLNNDPATWGTGAFVVRTPLVDNVRSMTFRYYNALGGAVNGTFDLSAVADDIGGSDAAGPKAQRASVRRIEVALVGLTREPDLGWVDSSDANPKTRAYRKFELRGDVTPRNLGMVGIRDLSADITPPTKPGAPTLSPGHCGGLYVSWPPNPAADQVVSYRVNYGTSPGSHPNSRSTANTSYYLGSLATGTTYYVAIQASDAGGNLSPESDERSATVTNTTTPKPPQGLQATTNLNGAVKTIWSAVTENTSNVPGDPASPMIRDLVGYRVYRGTASDFTPSPSNRIADESNVTASSSPLYTDATAVNCRDYFYKVTAADACGVESAPSAAAPGRAESSVLPKPPANVQAFVAGLNKARITWQPVAEDANGNAITIDTYVVFRSPRVATGTDPYGLTYLPIATVVGATEYVDSGAGLAVPGTTIWYRVKARDDCPNVSDFSNPAEPVCAFSGTVSITTPSAGAQVAGVVPTTVEVSGGSDTYVKATFQFYNNTTGQLEEEKEVTGPGPAWTYNWLADPPGAYTITAIVENDAGCTRSAEIQVNAGSDVGCCLSPHPVQNPYVMACTGQPGAAKKCKQVTYSMINNNCLTAVRLDEIRVTWTNDIGNNAGLLSVLFDGTAIWNPGGVASPASTAFSAPNPTIPVDRNASNPLIVDYAYDQLMSAKVGPVVKKNVPITTTYTFTLLDADNNPSAIKGACGPADGFNFTVQDP